VVSGLVVWNKSTGWVLGIYRSTQGLPRTETCGLTSQLRRAAVSVPVISRKVKPGYPRESLSNFWGTPEGSLVEVEAQILIAGELGCGGHDETQNWLAVTAEVGRILNRLLCSLPTRNSIPG